MVDLLVELEIYRSVSGVVHRIRVPGPAWAWLRADRGTFDVDHKVTGVEIVAAGRGPGPAGSNWPRRRSTRSRRR